MNKTVRIFIIGILLVMTHASLVMAGPKNSIFFPEIRLLVSTDNGQHWSENIKDLRMGQPFYLRVEISLRSRTKMGVFQKKRAIGELFFGRKITWDDFVNTPERSDFLLNYFNRLV
jgi:hypothetical protein